MRNCKGNLFERNIKKNIYNQFNNFKNKFNQF